jgi:signal transduction histidine kinase
MGGYSILFARASYSAAICRSDATSFSSAKLAATRRHFAASSRRPDCRYLATELVESFAPVVHDHRRTLLWSITPDLEVRGDRELLAQAAINLIENAQRHTPTGTIIRLTLAETADRVCLQVVDNGPGVANADLPHIVKKFTRLEASRNTGGYGLGLNLVSAVVALHGGKLV